MGRPPSISIILFRDLVDESPVVGYETDSALIITKGVRENLPGGDVEVVGRLIHEQQVGWLEEQLGQGYPGLFTAGQHGR